MEGVVLGPPLFLYNNDVLRAELLRILMGECIARPLQNYFQDVLYKLLLFSNFAL